MKRVFVFFAAVILAAIPADAAVDFHGHRYDAMNYARPSSKMVS